MSFVNWHVNNGQDSWYLFLSSLHGSPTISGWDMMIWWDDRTCFPTIVNWLVVWNIFSFPIYWECHHPNWLSYFSKGFKPPTSIIHQVLWIQVKCLGPPQRWNDTPNPAPNPAKAFPAVFKNPTWLMIRWAFHSSDPSFKIAVEFIYIIFYHSISILHHCGHSHEWRDFYSPKYHAPRSDTDMSRWNNMHPESQVKEVTLPTLRAYGWGVAAVAAKRFLFMSEAIPGIHFAWFTFSESTQWPSGKWEKFV